MSFKLQEFAEFKRKCQRSRGDDATEEDIRKLRDKKTNEALEHLEITKRILRYCVTSTGATGELRSGREKGKTAGDGHVSDSNTTKHNQTAEDISEDGTDSSP